MDPRTKFRGEVDLKHGAGASGLLLPDITSANIAFLEGTGNDSTAVVGDPFRPFYTAQAAITALIAFTEGGDCTISAGAGSFGDMDITGANSVTLLGKGWHETYYGNVSATPPVPLYSSTELVTVAGVQMNYANGADGVGYDGSGNGFPGNYGNAGDAHVYNVRSTSDILLFQGSGGAGAVGAPGDVFSSNGGSGGNGGPGGPGNLYVTDCISGGYFATIAGSGGAGGNGGDTSDPVGYGGDAGNGGNAGAGGNVYAVRSVANALYAAAGNPGGSGANGTGNMFTYSTPVAGNTAGAGTVNTQFCTVATDVANGETTNYKQSIVNGTSYN
jgi:hypothetical protein